MIHSLRPAVASDVLPLVRLLRRTWLITWAPELPFSAVQHFAANDPAAAFVEDMWQAFWVVENLNQAVAMCHVVDDYLGALHVDPAFQHRGIGRAMLAKAEDLIRERHKVARLDVLTLNSRAIRFYRDNGWEEYHRHVQIECGVTVEAITFTKRLR